MELWGTFQKGSAEGVLVIDWGGEEGTGPVKSVGSQHCPGGRAHVPSATPRSRPLRAAFVLREIGLWSDFREVTESPGRETVASPVERHRFLWMGSFPSCLFPFPQLRAWPPVPRSVASSSEQLGGRLLAHWPSPAPRDSSLYLEWVWFLHEGHGLRALRSKLSTSEISSRSVFCLHSPGQGSGERGSPCILLSLPRPGPGPASCV